MSLADFEENDQSQSKNKQKKSGRDGFHRNRGGYQGKKWRGHMNKLRE